MVWHATSPGVGCETEKTDTVFDKWRAGLERGFRPEKGSADKRQREAEELESVIQGQILHGHPITVSQCIFQAHTGRVRTITEARAVSEAVSATTKREAAFSDFVAPFAYRLACVGGGGQKTPRNVGGGGCVPENDDNDDEEGYCDNGDVGSGEKLLHLLQKWDIRHRMLMVTRIDGGFMRAELMGIRRYKFVIDRAKKLLENTDLLSLRRAVEADIHVATTAETAVNLAVHQASDGGRQWSLPQDHHCIGTSSVGGGWGTVGIRTGDAWDGFIMRLPTRRRTTIHTPCVNLLEPPQPCGGVTNLPSYDRGRGPRGRRGGSRATHVKIDGTPEGASAITRERRALSLTHLNISSKTVPFPRGHVASVMGDKGHGKKQGRINHFAVRTPPGPSEDGDSNGGGHGGALAQGLGPSAGPGYCEPCDGRHAMTSGWSLPHELDPTSSVTCPRKTREGTGSTVTRGGSNLGWANSSTHTAGASHASTCDTINSPSRVATIMLGVIPGISNDHSLHPPPPAVTGTAAGATAGRHNPRAMHRGLPSEGDGSSSSGGFSPSDLSLVGTASSSGAGVPGVLSSCSGTSCYPPHRPQLPNASTSGGRSVNRDAASSVGVLPRHPSTRVGTDGCGVCASGGGMFSSSVGEPARNDRGRVVGVDGYTLPSAAVGVDVVERRAGGGGGGSSSNGSSAAGRHSLPFLHRDLGSGVRDEPSPSLVVIPGGSGDGHGDGGDGSGGGGGAAAAAPPLSNESSMGRWRSDDDGSSSSMSTTAGGEAGAEPVDEDASAGEPRYRSGSVAITSETTPFAARSPGREDRQVCQTPAAWSTDDLGELAGTVVSGRSDPPPTRSKSALRGWSANRGAPPCSPLVTDNVPAPSKER